MNRVAILARDDLSGLSSITLQPQRSALRAIKVLLPVWGDSYIRQFLEYGLATLLAPGNLPALVAALPTEFVLLTRAEDEAIIRGNAAFERLAAACPTTIRSIDHLITDGNYSTTITIAFAESVMAVGDAMLDTCFFFLVSDYIIADGSLANALGRMQRGISAVVVGNFQVAREDALPWLQEKIAGDEFSLAISPRELMRWALANLHPTTLANTVNIPYCHNSHTNRLFWRIDRDAIQGRFYLMHMLCVRPEIPNFIIGSSCDYSFVPEMCPSGSVEAITDSDEYLVVEMQPRAHESAFLRLGPIDPRKTAESLNEWTTRVHRDNAHYPIIFHAGDVPPHLAESIEEADLFVARIARHFASRPMPYRGHPYWEGAMAAFNATAKSKLSGDKWLYGADSQKKSIRARAGRLLGSRSKGVILRWFLRARYVIMGLPPYVRPWHPSWPDFYVMLEEVRASCTGRDIRALIISNEPLPISKVLATNSVYLRSLGCSQFLSAACQLHESSRGTFDLCFIELVDDELTELPKLVAATVPLLTSSGRIVASLPTRGALTGTWDAARGVRSYMSHYGTQFIQSGAVLMSIRPVPAGALRSMVYRRLRDASARARMGGVFRVPLAIVEGGFLLGLSLIANLITLRQSRSADPRGGNSRVIMRLGVDVQNG